MLDFNEMMNKVKQLEKGEKLDLSSDEDLSIGIMNLIGIEEHLFFTANKTGKSSYYEILREVREMRKSLLKRIIKDYEGEVWCISKHLLSASMRLMEVGTKLLNKGDNKEAEEMFTKSYQLYSLFWSLNLGVVSIDKVKNESNSDKDKVTFISDKNSPEKKGEESIWSKMGQLVKKAIDCCKE